MPNQIVMNEHVDTISFQNCTSQQIPGDKIGPDEFPQTLEQLEVLSPLKGGTHSTYLVRDKETNKKYVSKFGSSDTQIKIEILMNVLYLRLGVPVPLVKAYFSPIPQDLADQFGLKTNERTLQLAEWVEPSVVQDAETIQKQATKNFIVHAYFGNIDATKPDNFIQCADGTVKLIDAGASFLYRSLGEMREEIPCEIVEIDSMRDKNTSTWFHEISESKIQRQATALIRQRDIIERTIWELSGQLELPSYIQNQLLTGFSNRLDGLARRFGFITQRFAMRDKAAIPNISSAGVLHLQRNDQGELCVLLSQRRGHTWCDNLGGKSEYGDVTLARTAQREVYKGSNKVIHYSDRELARASFHDLITEDKLGQHLYRMYIINSVSSIDTALLKDDEHPVHHWVSLRSLVEAIRGKEEINEEGLKTVKVDNLSGQPVIISPLLYLMLQQNPVLKLMSSILVGSFPKRAKHTQGFVDTPELTITSIYRPLTTPGQLKQDVILTALRKSKLLDDIKQSQRLAIKDINPSVVQDGVSNSKPTAHTLSQSELHLKTVMGDDFNSDESIAYNVDLFLEKYSEKKYSQEDKARLVSHAVDMIQYEKDHPGMVFFYHGVNNLVSYGYELYKSIYAHLLADSRFQTFRVDNPLFHKCLNVKEFIVHLLALSKDGNVYNYDEGYMQSIMSVNLFLFGNHQIDGSNTICFYTSNTTAEVYLYQMLLASLRSLGVSENTIKALTKLDQQSPNCNLGAIYQLAIPLDEVDEYAYLAAPGGRSNPFKISESTESIEISKLLLAMQDDLESIDEEYIEEVQSRILVPPGAPIEARKMVWGVSAINQRDIVQRKRLVKDCVFDILEHLNRFYALNNQTALVRFLPTILKQAGLASDSMKLTDELIVHLIEARDFESIKAIVQEHPEFKEKPLKSSKQDYSTGKIEYQSQTLLQRLLAMRHTGDIVRAIYGKRFYVGRLELLYFPHVLSTLPEEQKYNLAQHALEISDTKSLIDVLPQLPEGKRFDFAMDTMWIFESVQEFRALISLLSKNNKLERVQAYRNRVDNGTQLAILLEMFPSNERLDFAKAHQHKIQGGEELSFVLSSLPEAFRLDFAKAHQDKIQDGEELSFVLNSLPEAFRLDFAKAHQHKIQDGEELSFVLSSLPEAFRLDFAKVHQDDYIRDGEELAFVLSSLPEAFRLDFAKVHQDDCIRDGEELSLVLSSLPEKFRLDFAKSHQDKIQDGRELSFVLSSLPEEFRLSFAKAHQDKIKDCGQLASILSNLPVVERLAFAITHRDKIKDSDDLLKLVRSLPSDTILAFTREHQDKILDGMHLISILHALPHSERLPFANEHQDKVGNIADLAGVLSALPDYVKLAFAKHNQHKIKRSKQLASILLVLPKNERLTFATECLGKIDEIDATQQLSVVIKVLQKGDRLAFARTHHHRIRTAGGLAKVLHRLPINQRLVFAREQKDKIQDDGGLSEILPLLSTEERVLYLKEMLDIIRSGWPLITILIDLAMEERLAFVKEYQNKIRKSRELTRILECLPDEVRLEFAKELQDKIQDAEELLQVVKALPKRDRLVFAREQQDKIRNGYGLAELLKCLSKKERLAFAKEQQDKIQDVKELLKVVGVLQEEHIVTFTRENQNKFQSFEDFIQVIEALPMTQRLAFARENQNQLHCFDELIEVIEALPKEQRLEFARENQNQLRCFDEFIEVMETLPKAQRLAFAKEQLDKIENNKQYSDILETLRKEDCWEFFYAYKSRKSRQETLAFINVLDQYKEDRDNLEGCNPEYKVTFFCIGFGFKKSEKFAAVDALKDALSGDEKDLTPHLAALKNGELGKSICSFLQKSYHFSKLNIKTVSDLIEHLNNQSQHIARA